MKVAKWGNRLAVRLPAAVVRSLRLKEGDEIEIHIAGARKFAVARKPRRQDLLNKLRAYRGRLRETSSSTGRRRMPGNPFASGR